MWNPVWERVQRGNCAIATDFVLHAVMTLGLGSVIFGTRRLENSQFCYRFFRVAQIATSVQRADDRICRSIASSPLPTLVKLRNVCASNVTLTCPLYRHPLAACDLIVLSSFTHLSP
jgi:hypothetical protein